jgi:sirohydrochlorin ferrochelatase
LKPDSSTALLLIAHGSRSAAANHDLVHMAENLRAEGFPRVEISYLELAPPTIQEGGAACVVPGVTKVLMLPYFLSAGVHVQRDLEEARVQMETEHPGIRFLLAKPLGPHPQLLELLKSRGDEALAQVGS